MREPTSAILALRVSGTIREPIIWCRTHPWMTDVAMVFMSEREWYVLPHQNSGQQQRDAFTMSKMFAAILRLRNDFARKTPTVTGTIIVNGRAQGTWDDHDMTPTCGHRALAANTHISRFEICWTRQGEYALGDHEPFSPAHWSRNEAPVHIRAIQGHSSPPLVRREFMVPFDIPSGIADLIHHAGCSTDMSSVIENGLVAGDKDAALDARQHISL